MKSNDSALYQFDAQIREQFGLFCGVDEAGRGPLCGPVCCAAVILDPEDPIEGINDSKKLTEKRRETLFEQITSRAVAYQVVFVSPQEIDEKNILWATMDGMAQAVVKGDASSASIAAASILAKVSRDRYMMELDRRYPQYELAKHKGYPTRLHYERIAQYGIQPFYRRSFLKKQGYWHEK